MPGPIQKAPTCVPARYGLLSVAEVEEVSEGHWAADEGFQYDLESCGEILALSGRCTPTPENKSDALEGVGVEVSESFTLIAGYKCSVPGRPVSEAWDFAERRLTQGESRGVEKAFWTGVDSLDARIPQTLTGVDELDDPLAVDLTPVVGTAINITDATALLEDWAGDVMSCSPIIHVTRGIATYMAESGLITPSGQIMYAAGTGSRVAVGGGYSNTGPDGLPAAAGEGWMFISGGVKVLRAPMFFTPERGNNGAAINREINDIEVFAERTYGFELGCGLAAVLVDLNSCCG